MDYQPCPGSEKSQAASARLERKRLTNLCQLYLSDPENEPLRERFAECCIELLRRKVNYTVFKGHWPRSLAPGTFAEDAHSLAVFKFWTGISKLSHPRKLNAWLGKVATSAVFEELREHTRRLKDGPCSSENIEKQGADGETINVLDEAKNRQAAERNGIFAATCTPDLKRLIHRDILEKVFAWNRNGSKSTIFDFIVLRSSVEFTVPEIADRHGKSRATIRRSLKKSRQRFRAIAENQYDFTAADL
jgi:DNA-directed RNA polymerase specialized sigma24 family protein